MAALTSDATHRPTRTTDRSLDVIHFAAVNDADTYTTPLASRVLFATFEPATAAVVANCTWTGKVVTIAMSAPSAGTLFIMTEGA